MKSTTPRLVIPNLLTQKEVDERILDTIEEITGKRPSSEEYVKTDGNILGYIERTSGIKSAKPQNNKLFKFISPKQRDKTKIKIDKILGANG